MRTHAFRTLAASLLLAGALLAHPVRADGPRGFLLQVEVGEQAVGTGATARLVTPEGRTRDLALLDDGVPPDIASGDGVLTVGVPGFAAQKAAVEITNGDQVWKGSLTVDPGSEKPAVRLFLASEGEIQQVDLPNTPPASDPEPLSRSSPANDRPAPPTPGRAAPAPIDTPSRLQFMIWAAAIFAAGATVGAFGATFLPNRRHGRGGRRRR